MAAIFAFKCRRCGETHEGSPSFSFVAPDQYSSLTDEQKAKIGELSEDFCTISHATGTDRFIRTVLEVPIHGVKEPFLFGVWVSVSEKSFDHYRETFEQPIAGDGFFGWVCDRISLYPYGHPRPADVVVQLGGKRPQGRTASR